MTDGNDAKTKAQLLAEIEALRKQLAARDKDGAGQPVEASTEPSLSRPMTRREAIGRWIAPVILSVPVTAAMRPGTAQAQVPPTGEPTQAPSPPTQAPSPPTQAPSPPTQVPTQVPTQAPTRAAQEIPGIGLAGAAALGGALAAMGAKLLKDRTDAPGDDESDGGDKKPTREVSLCGTVQARPPGRGGGRASLRSR